MSAPSLQSFRVGVTDSSQIGEARRFIALLARQLQFSEDEAGKVGIIATEAATNLVRHAGGGRIVFRPLYDRARRGVEILAIDSGPGMANITACMRDGFSTAGTAGQGLGSMKRLSSEFDLFSIPGKGTVLVSQVWVGENKFPSPLQIGAICLAVEGESVSGDNWWHQDNGSRQVIALADGLGHGVNAATAANEAIRVVRDNAARKATEMLGMAHGALRATRGAAMSIAEINLDKQLVSFAGVGNVAGSIVDGKTSRSMVSHNGTLGSMTPKCHEFTYPWPAEGTMVLHSDGLMTRWNLDAYGGLAHRHPSLMAAVLYRDFHRERDDITVLVIKAARRGT